MSTTVANSVLRELVDQIVQLRAEVARLKEIVEPSFPEGVNPLGLEEEDDSEEIGDHTRARTWEWIVSHGHREESCFGGKKCWSYAIGMPNERTFYGMRIENGRRVHRGFNKLKLVARWVYESSL